MHLVGTLRELGVSEEIIHEVASAITPLAGQIVNTQTSHCDGIRTHRPVPQNAVMIV
jgi:hypothetical protein